MGNKASRAVLKERDLKRFCDASRCECFGALPCIKVVSVFSRCSSVTDAAFRMRSFNSRSRRGPRAVWTIPFAQGRRLGRGPYHEPWVGQGSSLPNARWDTVILIGDASSTAESSRLPSDTRALNEASLSSARSSSLTQTTMDSCTSVLVFS